MFNRSISPIILTATLDIPAISTRLNADWERDIATQLCLATGDVEELPLARARLRWPDYKQCLEAMTHWTQDVGLQDVLSTAEIALMACRGARYHNDVELYCDSAFCNLFLSEDKSLDLHFPAIGLRIPLVRGTTVIFDTALTHGVIQRRATEEHGFKASDFPPELDCSQVFLTWELPIENAHVSHALGISFQ